MCTVLLPPGDNPIAAKYIVSYHMRIVWISKQTAIISLRSINGLVFIIEMKCIYCAVRTGSLNITVFNFNT